MVRSGWRSSWWQFFNLLLFLTLSSVVASSVRDFQQKQREALYGRHQLLYVGNQGFCPVSAGAVSPGWRSAELRERRMGGKTVGSISESYQQVANLTLKEGRLPQGRKRNSFWWIRKIGITRWAIRSGFHMNFLTYLNKRVRLPTPFRTLLEGLNQNREYYLDLAAELWDPFVQSDSGASTLPVHMLHPMNELTAEQQDEAFHVCSFAAGICIDLRRRSASF